MEENEAASQADTQEDGKAARMQAKADLLAHLGTLINRSSLSDLEFICKGAVRVKACRIFLEGRSPVFDSMLTNGMLESNSSVINLPEVPAPALLAIVELLYTGNIVDYWPTDWQMGLEIMSVAHFFLLSTVDKIVEEFMVAQISRASEDLQEAAIMLSVALTFKCLSHDESAPFLKLASLLESDWMVTAYACYLSKEAVAFILRHTKPILKIENRLETSVDLEVYFCFRGILLWCMYNNRSEPIEEVDQVINRAMPVARENLYSKGNKDLSSLDVVWLPDYKGEPAQAEILQCLHSQGTFEAAIRLLAHVDWIRMPPSIFVKVVEPMKLLSESRVVEIFRFHYLNREISIPLKLSWDASKSYSICSNGFIIKKILNSSGSAICKLVTRARDDRCIWRFSIQRADANSRFQLGFVCSTGVEDPSQTWNFYLECVDASRGSGTCELRVVQWQPNAGAIYFSGHGISFRSRNAHIVTNVKTIEFEYQRSTQSCAVSVDDTKLGTVWGNLPATSIFPVLSMGYYSGTEVQLEVVSGFEIF